MPARPATLLPPEGRDGMVGGWCGGRRLAAPSCCAAACHRVRASAVAGGRWVAWWACCWHRALSLEEILGCSP